MKNKIYNTSKIIAVFAFVLVSFCSAFAQTNMTKIQDASIPGSSTIPVKGAVLELESTNKGLLVPRITTAQRDNMPVANRADGLLIYNTTSGCFNHWSALQTTWLSICGTPPPAVVNITPEQCSNIVVNGTYTQGIVISDSNYLNIPVTVSQPGTYSISAVTNNGYYFEKNGSFPAAGNYNLLLQGVGIPNNATPTPGDTVAITINGLLRACTINIEVIPANVDYTINNCGTISAAGTYNIGIPLSDTNKMSLTVNVITPGFWSITSNTVNGYSFSGSGTFTSTGVQNVEILGTGQPIASGTNNFNLSSNALSATTCTNIPVTVDPVAYTVNCASSVVSGSYMENVALTGANTMTLSVDVTATGQTTITSNTVNGISFSSGVIELTTLGVQNIILTGSGTPLVPGTSSYTITGTGFSAATSCAVDVTIQRQPIAYTINCSGITLSGSYAPGLAMNASNTMSVPVTVNYIGDYTISTNAQNGISFSGSGTFTGKGSQNVTLTATGTPTDGGSFDYTLTSNSTVAGPSCNTTVKFSFRKINVLGLGAGTYQPGTATASQSTRGILQSLSNFGPTGVVKVEGINIVNGAGSMGASLSNLINNNDIDIIVIAYTYFPNAASILILEDFVKNKKGVLIHSQEYELPGALNLINRISDSSSMNLSIAGATWLNPVLSISDPILNGPFRDLKGSTIGADLNSSSYLTGLPANMISLATKNGVPNSSFVTKHATLGYIFIGDSGWTAGDITNTSTTIWPAKMSSTGVPQTKAYNSGSTVINSFLYANVMAWAIQYVQENTVIDYDVK